MSKADGYELDLLKLLFNATAIANVADNAASSPLTNLYVSLHTADPTDTGSQTSSEAAYTGYARVAVPRTTGGWTCSGTTPAQAVPVANIDFGLCTASPGGPVTFFGIGSLVSGAGKLFYSGPVTPNITMAIGVIPRLTTATGITED